MVSISFAPQGLLGGRRIADVPLDEHDLVFDVGQVGSVAGVGEHVVDDDMVLGVLLHPVTGEIRPDETGTSRDEKAHKGDDVSPGPGTAFRGSGRAEVDHVAGRHDVPGALRILDHQPAVVVDRHRPSDELGLRAARPGRPGPAWRSGPAPRRPGGGGPTGGRARAAGRPGGRAGARAGRSGRPGRRPAPSSSRQVPPPSEGRANRRSARYPATTAVGPAAELRLGQDPGQLGPADQQVVGPLERRLDPGHLGAGVDGGQREGTRAQVQVVRARNRGRSRTEARRLAPGGDSQRRSRRPRPAVWWSATATRPSGAPRRACSRK